MTVQDKYGFFRTHLMEWYRHSARPLPWKEEQDTYLIWLSEIILQQTRVEQGMPYFLKFREAYPTVQDLARAPLDEVMKLWEGLGYYARARNLHEAARWVANELDGVFPSTYEGLLKLKGIGPYTAAAIASFAFDLPHAVVDGNVFRVLSRFLGADQPIDTTSGKKFFAQQAQFALDKTDPGRYNQAIMDFGATVCRPKNPTCTSCPMQSQCQALKKKMVDQLPVKSKKIERRERFFHFIVFNIQNQVCIQKRTGNDIWRNLYAFPVLEKNQLTWHQSQLLDEPAWKQWLAPGVIPKFQRRSKPFQQTLTHQVITAAFWEFELSAVNELVNETFLFVKRKNLPKFAFPKIVDWYLSDNSLYLNLQ